jgi:phosphinothricin acetyltransferase
VDTAVYVSSTAHRRRVGTALYTSLFEILRLQGLRNAYAGVTLPNPGSEGMHRAFGFALVGIYRHVGYKMGSWHDVAWFERPISEAVIDPSEPVTFPEVRDSPEVAAALGKGQALLA